MSPSRFGKHSLLRDAWKNGYERAVADGPSIMRGLLMAEHASEAACNEALRVYVPMELDRFRDIVTLAWCGGYWPRVQEPGAAEERATCSH